MCPGTNASAYSSTKASSCSRPRTYPDTGIRSNSSIISYACSST